MQSLALEISRLGKKGLEKPRSLVGSQGGCCLIRLERHVGPDCEELSVPDKSMIF